MGLVQFEWGWYSLESLEWVWYGLHCFGLVWINCYLFIPPANLQMQPVCLMYNQFYTQTHPITLILTNTLILRKHTLSIIYKQRVPNNMKLLYSLHESKTLFGLTPDSWIVWGVNSLYTGHEFYYTPYKTPCTLDTSSIHCIRLLVHWTRDLYNV